MSHAGPPIVVTANHKGGVGKSTTSISLGCELATAGLRVVLVDTDTQASATDALGLEKVQSPDSAYPQPLEPVALPAGATGSLRVARGGTGLLPLNRATLEQHVARCAEDADVVVVDSGPHIAGGVAMLLGLATHIIIPLEPEFLPARGLQEMLAMAQELAPEARVFALLTKFNPQRRLARQMEEAIANAYPGILMQVRIPMDVRVAEAAGRGVPVQVVDKGSRAAASYRALALELLASMPALGGALTHE